MQNKEDFNSEPVAYCTRCLSLKILGTDYTDYCDDCGNTVTTESSIEEWEELYKERYGETFLNKK